MPWYIADLRINFGEAECCVNPAKYEMVNVGEGCPSPPARPPHNHRHDPAGPGTHRRNLLLFAPDGAPAPDVVRRIPMEHRSCRPVSPGRLASRPGSPVRPGSRAVYSPGHPGALPGGEWGDTEWSTAPYAQGPCLDRSVKPDAVSGLQVKVQGRVEEEINGTGRYVPD